MVYKPFPFKKGGTFESERRHSLKTRRQLLKFWNENFPPFISDQRTDGVLIVINFQVVHLNITVSETLATLDWKKFRMKKNKWKITKCEIGDKAF